MNDEYIIISKSKAKKTSLNLFLLTVIACGFVWICVSKPFLGFGYHNFTEQLFRLLSGILVPLIIMTTTDYLTTVMFGNKKFTYIIVLLETILICTKSCYSFLCSTNGELFGFSEPEIIIFLCAVLFLLFWLTIYFVQILILHKLISNQISKAKIKII